ncbi:Tex family protein [Balneolales bacterium ANBcel1]|nr:Tex family protein [Balneolales bacterium ANBcel1]
MASEGIISQIAKEINMAPAQVAAVSALLDEGATIPFIARYRQERTGGLDEEQLRDIRDRLEFIRLLNERRESILGVIREQGKLTEELAAEIASCKTLKELEDLYLPYKPKRKTRASVAREKGLEPLAILMWEEENVTGDPETLAMDYLDAEKNVHSVEEALQGARDICAEWINEEVDIRNSIRKQIERHGVLSVTKTKQPDEKETYREYYEFAAKLTHVRPHQILAVNRGEREGILSANIEILEDKAVEKIERHIITNSKSIFTEQLKLSAADAFRRLLFPALEREARKELTGKAEEHAIGTFAENLKNLLLQPPLSSQNVIGIDPGYRTGCKVAVVDATGKYLEGTTIYPTPPRKKIRESIAVLDDLIERHGVSLIAIGNGTGSRETEQVVAELIGLRKEKKADETLHYLIVNEAGASVYSASPLAKQEFPDLEAAMRGNISIARRVQDPLAELVKIDPKSIGVGLYQHDVNQVQLSRKLDDVVESCVNMVGINVNTASSALLAYVSGLSSTIAKNIVLHRDQNGPFRNREQLRSVAGVGEFRFQQAAGFLRIPDSPQPLDNTAIHPESYEAAEIVCKKVGIEPGKIRDMADLLPLKFRDLDLDRTAESAGIGLPTLKLIIENLQKPGRDPRESLPKPLLKQNILSMSDLREGQELEGTVRNVVDFGAFVDIGVKQDGLLHISKMSDRKRVNNPHEVVSVGDIIRVRIDSLDEQRGRIGLEMVTDKKPAT